MSSFFDKLFGGAAGTIMKAARNGNLDKVKELLRNEPELVNAGGGKNKETPLFKAVESGNPALVEFLLSKGADVNARDKAGDTPLHKASMLGQQAIVKLLLDSRADVNSTGQFSWRPLHCASVECNTSLMGLLIDRGADVNAKNESGFTPLHLVVLKDVSAVQLLLSKGADVNVKGDKTGQTPLGYLISRSRFAQEYDSVCKALEQHGGAPK